MLSFYYGTECCFDRLSGIFFIDHLFLYYAAFQYVEL